MKYINIQKISKYIIIFEICLVVILITVSAIGAYNIAKDFEELRVQVEIIHENLQELKVDTRAIIDILDARDKELRLQLDSVES